VPKPFIKTSKDNSKSPVYSRSSSPNSIRNKNRCNYIYEIEKYKTCSFILIYLIIQIKVFFFFFDKKYLHQVIIILENNDLMIKSFKNLKKFRKLLKKQLDLVHHQIRDQHSHHKLLDKLHMVSHIVLELVNVILYYYTIILILRIIIFLIILQII